MSVDTVKQQEEVEDSHDPALMEVEAGKLQEETGLPMTEEYEAAMVHTMIHTATENIEVVIADKEGNYLYLTFI